MIQIKDKSKCCGCRACVQICPKHCITFVSDDEGFSYPSVNIDICVDCGLCEKTCPELNLQPIRTPLRVLAAINKSEETRKESSSGGVFSLFAEEIIKEGGVVFGACFDQDWNVIHTYEETLDGIKKFQKSKYVQSNIGDSYKEAKRFLNENRKVLFSGTPCQISGLKKYLGKEYDNLLTIDFVCHGVPSPMVWKDYLNEVLSPQDCAGKNTVSLSLSEMPTIKCISFRDKTTGWEKFGFVVRVNSASKADKNSVLSSYNTKDTILIHERLDVNQYMRTFLSNIDLRVSCYSCTFKRGRSGADVTIADFWGVQLFHPRFNDNKGTSLIMVYTDKGYAITDRIPLIYEESSLKKAVRCNSAIVRSHHVHPNRHIFFKHYHTKESKIQWMKECESVNVLQSIKMKFQNLTDRIISKIQYLL